MAKYVKVREVCVRLQLDESTLRRLAEEGLVKIQRPTSGDDDIVSAADAERLRVITVLMQEMEVNLPGVEVILHMREELLSMRRQIDEVVQTLVKELREHIADPDADGRSHEK